MRIFCPEIKKNPLLFKGLLDKSLTIGYKLVESNTIHIMKSRKNLTRFTYETTAFQGWRLSLSRSGTTFTKYFSDKKYGTERKALKAAEAALKDLKELVENSRKINGKLSKTTINKSQKLLKDA